MTNRRFSLPRELVRAAATRLPGSRLLAGLAGSAGPVVVEARPGGGVAVVEGLELPMQVLFARVRALPVGVDPDGALIPRELLDGGAAVLISLDYDGFRGVLIAEGIESARDGAELTRLGDALAMSLAAAAAGADGPSPAETLDDLARLLAASPRPGRILTRMAAEICATTSLERCTVLLLGSAGELVPAASETGDGPAPLAPWRSLLAAGPLPALAAAMAAGVPAAYHDAAAEPDLVPERFAIPLEVGRVLVTPMVVWGEPVGALICDAPTPGSISDDERQLIGAIAAQAALGVKVAHLVDTLEEGQRHARLVLGAMAQAATQLSSQGVLAVVAEVAYEVLGDATVVGFTAADGRPETVTTAGETNGAAELAAELAAAPPPAGPWAHYGDEVAARLPAVATAQRALVVPISRSGRHLAWVVSYGPSRRAYRAADLRAIAALAGQAALSLQAVRLLERERESVARLQELSRRKTGFVATVSHELRTPLTAILGFSEILNEWIEDPEMRSFVEDVHREAVVLERIIGNLLDTTRLEAGALALDRAPIDIELLVKESIDVIGHGFPYHRLELDIEPALPQVWGDQVRVRQVLLNLLENAAKYSPEEGRIGVRLTPEHDAVRIEICDEGPGIPLELRERVFERFFRLDDRHQKPGTGIGLYLVRELIEAHGGSVTIGDGPGGAGCCVIMRLPAG